MLRFDASPPGIAVSHDARVAAGLEHWPDGTIGILRHEGCQIAIGPNGRSSARHDLAHGGLAHGLVRASEQLVDPIEVADHRSGGPLWLHPDSGTVLLSYHAERFDHGDPADYWSWLGLAVGAMDGRPFTDLGATITSDLAEDSSRRMRPIDAGPGALVEHHGHLLVYFLDRANIHARVNLGLARAPVDEVVAAARAGHPPRLHKYFAGRFDEPGLAGRATDLLPDPRHRILWLDVAYLSGPDLLVMVQSTPLLRVRGQVRWGLIVRTSEDGITWTEGQVIHEGPFGTELIYVTIDGGGHPGRAVLGDHFDLYVTSSTTAFRWDHTDLLRMRVTWSS